MEDINALFLNCGVDAVQCRQEGAPFRVDSSVL